MRSPAGRFRHLARIERKGTPTRDAMGGEVLAWELVADVRCAIEPLRGREYIAARAERADLTTRIVLPYRPGLTVDMRVVHRGTAYDVRDLIDVRGERRELELMCSSEAVQS